MINSNKRKIGFLLIFLGVILIVVIVLLFLSPDKNIFKNLFNRDKNTEEVKTPEQIFEEMKAQKEAEVVYTFDAQAEANRDWTEDDFRQIARPFVERLGSYSNQSDYGNIDDLKIFMTAEMKTWADTYMAKLKAESSEQDAFYGITTKALVEPEITKFDLENEEVELIVSTQREETSSDKKNNVFSQKIKINFTKENGEWLVDGAFWQK